ncbi:short-chain dehydrogenase reductase SDR [Lactobacillus selangorensis]|uniref:Short-chain dehydrogenase reductase SDR n=1 Tax=Lactobacillus selangorensis TaxID=81857 RepID=A0A0R2G1N7_9LACO|nr:SDR family oxidoreductase [Lactobacillus selangorensis]KRN28231.1 short-chain dehydrogenase reductase SDR [Lactobacillus selangorensis]KRN30893.1 short-chain dehydrogenase reductase SDR [Lactobacillus selangorensis]
MTETKDKVIVITGASSGIGAETARVLAQKGAKIVLAARNEAKLKQVADTINQAGGTAVYCVTDVTDHGQVAALVQFALEKFHKIDVLFANAGLMPLSYLRENKYHEWDQTIDVNLKGVLYAIGEVIPIMEQQGGGQIIATDSIAGHRVSPGNAVYAGTKYALRAIMNGLRAEEGPTKCIRVAMISPGNVSTNLYTGSSNPEVQKSVHNAELNAGLVTKDIANAVAYAIEQPGNVEIDELILQSIHQKG